MWREKLAVPESPWPSTFCKGQPPPGIDCCGVPEALMIASSSCGSMPAFRMASRAAYVPTMAAVSKATTKERHVACTEGQVMPASP